MNRIVRRRLEMAVRARDFSRAHPSTDANYAAVLGELIAFAFMVVAPITGVLSTVLFRRLIRRRIVVEEQALRERAS